MRRAVLLQTVATKSKNKALKDFSKRAVILANSLLAQRKSRRLMDLHRATYLASKKTTSFRSQVICDIERNVARSKGTILKRITVKFNIPRNCKTFKTKANFFISFGMYPKQTLPIPVKQNRNFQRLQSLFLAGWQCKTFGLTSDQQIVAYLSREDVILPERRNVLGIDVNSKCFAVSILSPNGDVLKQTYFGKDIWHKRKQIFMWRGILQSLAAKCVRGTKRKLERAKRKERNFVKNRLGEIVRDITEMALRFNADIAIENLKQFTPKGKRFNREVMRIPFYQFKLLLESRCFDKNITLNIVDSWHTSKWCSHCGAVGNGHSSTNYSLFRCECGQIVNSDRKASLAIAIKSFLERSKIQFSRKRVSVNRLLCRNDEIVFNDAVHLKHSPIESHLTC